MPYRQIRQLYPMDSTSQLITSQINQLCPSDTTYQIIPTIELAHYAQKIQLANYDLQSN